ncbi:MAG TPA: DUF6152 family protein [Steroidobacteraceae bacterium]|jgi:hypothetical protein|nr:DUF6152 family protein [Steroidobacteraceae bacterium]
MSIRTFKSHAKARTAAAAIGIVLLMQLGTATAHHSAAMFDHSKTITLHGTVKNFQFTNPHSWLIVMVTRTDGEPVEWGFEAEGPSTLLHAGILPKSFRPGDKVTVVANPMRDGRPAGALISVVTADGSVYRTGPGAPPARRAPVSKE